jgi:hypothetical protein
MVLPEPDSPTSASFSPAAICRLTPWTTSSPPKAMRSLRTSSSGPLWRCGRKTSGDGFGGRAVAASAAGARMGATHGTALGGALGTWSALRGSSASRKASPMKVNSSSVTTSTPKVDSEIHQASMLFLPCDNSSPSDGVPGGTPRPRKSSEVSARMAALMRNGRKVTTGVMLLGKTWRVMICQLLRPSARAART